MDRHIRSIGSFSQNRDRIGIACFDSQIYLEIACLGAALLDYNGFVELFREPVLEGGSIMTK